MMGNRKRSRALIPVNLQFMQELQEDLFISGGVSNMVSTDQRDKYSFPLLAHDNADPVVIISRECYCYDHSVSYYYI